MIALFLYLWFWLAGIIAFALALFITSLCRCASRPLPSPGETLPRPGRTPISTLPRPGRTFSLQPFAFPIVAFAIDGRVFIVPRYDSFAQPATSHS